MDSIPEARVPTYVETLEQRVRELTVENETLRNTLDLANATIKERDARIKMLVDKLDQSRYVSRALCDLEWDLLNYTSSLKLKV